MYRQGLTTPIQEPQQKWRILPVSLPACLLEGGGPDGQLHVAPAVDRTTVTHPFRRELGHNVAVELGRLEKGARAVLWGTEEARGVKEEG
jgi:hypothetical protein